MPRDGFDLSLHRGKNHPALIFNNMCWPKVREIKSSLH